MNPMDYARLKQAFLSVALAPEEVRPAALARACGDDALLRARVEAVLAGNAPTLFSGATASTPEASLEGVRIGSIRVECRVAEGGMGTVYRGYDERLGRTVALKSIRQEWRVSPEARRRFLREARALGRLKHPGVCEIYGYEETPQGDYLVLEFIDGRSLTEVMVDPIPRDERDRISAALAEVLRATHGAGIVHRDLKPDNIMLTKQGVVKVIDFGIAEDAADERVGGDALRGPPRAAGVIGTPRYMSPEQTRGESAMPASDVYSLGLIMLQLYSGPRGRKGAQALELTRGLSRSRRLLVERMLTHEPAARPTAAEVANSVRRIRELPKRWAQAAVASLLVLVAAVAAVRYVVTIRAERARAELARSQAEQLVNVLLDEGVLASDRRDLITRVSEETQRYFEDLPRPLRDEARARLARSFRHRADAQFQRWEDLAAGEVFQRALELDEFVATEAQSPQAIEALVYDLDALSEIAARRGDFATALAQIQRAVALNERRVADQPAEASRQAALAITLMTEGRVRLSAGEALLAHDRFKAAGALYRALLARVPEDMRFRFGLAGAKLNTGHALLVQGDLDRAIAEYRECLEVFVELSTEAPDNLNCVGFAGESRLGLARALERRAEFGAALENIEAARAGFTQNRDRDRSRFRWTFDLRAADLLAARVLRQLGDEGGAKERLARAAFSRPTDTAPLLLHGQWAEIELELGHLAAARPVVERLIALGWHRLPANAGFAQVARQEGLLP